MKLRHDIDLGFFQNQIMRCMLCVESLILLLKVLPLLRSFTSSFYPFQSPSRKCRERPPYYISLVAFLDQAVQEDYTLCYNQLDLESFPSPYITGQSFRYAT